jgi:hypothetical protein
MKECVDKWKRCRIKFSKPNKSFKTEKRPENLDQERKVKFKDALNPDQDLNHNQELIVQ